MTPVTVECLRRASPAAELDERAARRTLRSQVARLERELVEQRCSTWPRPMRAGPAGPPAARGAGQPPTRGAGPPFTGGAGPRSLTIGELEAMRDELVASLAAERRALAERMAAEEERRCLREELMLDPAANAGARVSNADVGEGGCGEVRSEPAGGLLGMLMGWWRVVISSGCP
jgi:hypothetical protein